MLQNYFQVYYQVSCMQVKAFCEEPSANIMQQFISLVYLTLVIHPSQLADFGYDVGGEPLWLVTKFYKERTDLGWNCCIILVMMAYTFRFTFTMSSCSVINWCASDCKTFTASMHNSTSRNQATLQILAGHMICILPRQEMQSDSRQLQKYHS